MRKIYDRVYLTDHPVYLSQVGSGADPQGPVCVASQAALGRRSGDLHTLCGDPATRSIGKIRLCERHYDETAQWRDQRPPAEVMADLDDRHARELDLIEREREYKQENHRRSVEYGLRQIALVYYLRRCDGLIKIGTSRNLKRRMNTLGKEHGPLTLLLTHGGDGDREGEIHEKFAELRVTGEWFLARKRLTDWIRKCRLDPVIAGSQEPETADMDAIRELATEGNRASRAAGREYRERMEAESNAARERIGRMLLDGTIPRLGQSA